MSNIPEFFAPDMSVDFEELGERIDLDKIRSGEILSANGSRQNLPMNLLNILNDENSIHPDAEYDSKVEPKDDVYAVNLNKMSIEHLLQNDDVNEISCTNYFSEILMNDNEEYSVKKVKSDYVEISPLKPNLLNENAFTSFDDIVRTHIDDVVGSPQQKDAFKDVEGEYTHISQSNERETVEASLGNHVTSIESGNIINLSDNAIIERASVLKSNELIDSLVINKSGSGERTTRETAFENSDHLQNFVDKDMSNEDSNDLQTGALHLLADLAIADINASPVLVIEEVHNISQSEINAQEIPINNDNQIEIKNMICQERQNFYNGLPELQFLPEQSNKDFEHKHDMIDSSMIPEVHNELSGDLQSAEHIFTKDNEIHLADDNLPLSPSCEQINVTEIEDSPDNNELIKNQPLTGEQIIEDTENASTSQEEPHSNESITESIKCEVVLPTSSKGEQQLTRPASIIITRSMIASLNLKDSTSSMSLDEKKQLLMEVRKKKSMLRSSILRNKQAQNVGEDNKNRLRMNSSKLLSPQKKAPNKLNNTALTRLTKQNTDKNKEYRCELNVVVVRKNVPKPLSPTSKLHEKTKNGGITSALRSHNNKGKDNMGSYIPVLKSRSGRQNLTNQNESSNKGVHWNESRLIQESSPLIKSSPRTARQKPIPKSCLKQTNPPIDSLGNVLNANKSLTPLVKRGIKVTVKQVKYKGEE